jgi:OOP family OmpA-OmpF porin
MKKKLILAAAVTVVTSTAFAAQEGFYAGVNAGAAQQNIDGAGSKKENPTSWGLYGGYNFTRNFGLELGYQDLGEAKIDGQSKVKSQALSTDMVGRYALTDRFDVFGKAGLSYFKRKLTLDTGGEDSKYGTAGKLALGGEFAATQNIGVRVEVAEFLGAPTFTGANYEYKKNITAMTMGVNYHF